eukprot:1141438-Pelagomonas_calceolata.AAC.6
MQASPNILCNGPAVKLARVEPKERTSHECSMFTGPKVTEPHVYLDFTSEGRPLGRVVRRDPAKGLGGGIVRKADARGCSELPWLSCISFTEV